MLYFEILNFLSFNKTPGRVSLSNVIFVEYALQTKKKNLKDFKFQFSSHFLQFTVVQVLKSFSGRNNPLKSHVFRFSDDDDDDEVFLWYG